MILDSSDLDLVNKVSFGAMTKKAKSQEEIQERVALLLRAQSQYGKIVELMVASRRTVYNIKRKIEGGISLKHVKEAIRSKFLQNL